MPLRGPAGYPVVQSRNPCCRASLKPLLPSLQALAATTNCATPTACAAQFYAATAYVPIISQLEAAGAAYATKHGVLYP